MYSCRHRRWNLTSLNHMVDLEIFNMPLIILSTTSTWRFKMQSLICPTEDQMKVDIYLDYLARGLTRNSFPWFVRGSLRRAALTIFTLDNVWFQAPGEAGFLGNALLALSPLINDLGHVARDINTISVVIKKRCSPTILQQLSLCLSHSLTVSLHLSPFLSHPPPISLTEPWSTEEIIQEALAWSETWKRETLN